MIWVIGNKGMLGTEVCRQLTEKKIDYVATDIEVDITDIESIRDFARAWNITYIVNCAAYTAVDKAETDVELAKKLNTYAPGNIAKVAKEKGAILIHISTDYVFDGSENNPRTEEMPVKPIGVYGITKAAGEDEVSKNTEKYYILRTAWLYGWAGKNFVYTMIKAMNTHESVKVVNDQFGTPTFAGDLANVILQIINRKKVPYGVYHCTDIGEITWYDFTCEIKKQTSELGLLKNIGCIVNPCSTKEYPTPAKRPLYSVLSKEKIQNALNIELPDWKKSLTFFLTNQLFDKSRVE